MSREILTLKNNKIVISPPATEAPKSAPDKTQPQKKNRAKASAKSGNGLNDICGGVINNKAQLSYYTTLALVKMAGLNFSMLQQERGLMWRQYINLPVAERAIVLM